MLKKFKNCLTRLINSMRGKYNSLNPYLDHINLFIYYNVIPYKSIEHLKAGKYDRIKMVKIAAYVTIVCINLLRFLGIVLQNNYPQISLYFFIFFENQPNHEYIYITIILLFISPTILCNYIF